MPQSESRKSVERFALDGRTIVVTGASRGLGRGIALALLQTGASVFGIGRDATSLDETAVLAMEHATRFHPVVADLSDDDSLEAAHEAAWAGGPVSGVVHAAGVQLRKPAIDISREEWRRIAKIQLETPFFLSTAIARRQIEKAFGQATSSSARSPAGSGSRLAPYAASKSGMLGVTHARGGVGLGGIRPTSSAPATITPSLPMTCSPIRPGVP